MNMPRIELNPGLTLSRLAYGVWRLSEAADTSAQAVAGRIQACLDQGITTFDHADIYGGYSCEALFGAALRAQPGLKARMAMVKALYAEEATYLERLEYELGIINRMGFPGYFLIVSDFMKWRVSALG